MGQLLYTYSSRSTLFTHPKYFMETFEYKRRTPPLLILDTEYKESSTRLEVIGFRGKRLQEEPYLRQNSFTFLSTIMTDVTSITSSHPEDVTS